MDPSPTSNWVAGIVKRGIVENRTEGSDPPVPGVCYQGRGKKQRP